MKNVIQLEQNNLRELSFEETKETNGGFLPLVAIGVCWGVMALCSAVALGMKAAMDEK